MAYFPLNVRQDAIPIQMLSMKEKDEDWKKACMDSLESIGRKQYLENVNILENYRLVNNELLYNHYVFTESATDLAQTAMKEFDLPPYLRHYDITRKVINVLSGEYQSRPDNFRVAAIDEFAQNEYLRHKKDLLMEIVVSSIQKGIQEKLAQQGFDPNKNDFESEEEAQQYQQQYQEAEKQLTPEEIESYMKESYRGIGERWAEMVINLDKQRFNTPEMEIQEFEDMLICDRAYRHFYLKANGLGYSQETWNPIRVFFHKSPDLRYVEDGDYVGRVFYISIPEIINRYGHKMPRKQLESLYGEYLKKNKLGGTEYSFFQAANVPFENYPEYARTVQALGFDPHTGVPYTGSMGNFTSQDVDVLFNSSSSTYNLQGLTQATEAYWRSQKKVGFLIMKDPETGEIIEELVDETFIVPDFVTEVDDDPSYEDLVFYPEKNMNTIRWTWVNEVWGGTKLNITTSETPGGVYIDVKPIPFQFKGDTNPYEVKLPVCGAIFNNRNAKSMSIVDMMKPYQILYNVFMNKIYQLASTDIGKILLLDPRLIPNDKDWGGEKNIEKWVTSTRNSKIGQIDTSPGARGGTPPGQQQWTVTDMTTFDEIKATVEIARLLEEQAMFQVGITQQRLGIVQASETATGVKQSVSNSYAQTESYFTKFSNYKKRVLQMNLDIAQYCSATDRDMTLSLIQDDMTREFIKMNGVELLNSQLAIRVFNSQELLRQNELVKQLILKNNTANASMSALAASIYTESPSKLVSILKKMEADMKADMQAQRDHEQQMVDKEIQARQQEKAQDQAFEAEQNALDRESRIREKIISVANFDQDVQDNGEIDVVGIGKLQIDAQKLENDKVLSARDQLNKTLEGARKHKIEKDKIAADKEIKAKEAAMKEKEMNNRIEIENKKKAQIDAQSKNQERMQNKQIAADMALKNKDLQLKEKDIELKELTITGAKKGLKTDDKLEKFKELGAKDDLQTRKKLNRIKITNAKKPKKSSD